MQSFSTEVRRGAKEKRCPLVFAIDTHRWVQDEGEGAALPCCAEGTAGSVCCVNPGSLIHTAQKALH